MNSIFLKIYNNEDSCKALLYISSLVFLFASIAFAQDGSLDTSFDTDGIVTTDINSDNDKRNGQSDGKIIAAGVSNSDFALVRYNNDGTLDTSFDSDGKVTTGFGGDEHYARS